MEDDILTADGYSAAEAIERLKKIVAKRKKEGWKTQGGVAATCIFLSEAVVRGTQLDSE